ncbi:MAG: hypothetical protein DYG92_03320 [Leptolyngbya sp. PLA1]|nr:hypothetical protein [Leptolyngbya sp. PLA1]
MWFGLLLTAGAVFGAAFLLMRREEQRALDTLRTLDINRQAQRPVAEVASALRSLKLITVEIDTSVTVEKSDFSWRGDVSAKVTVPVRISFGTDLSAMSVTNIAHTTLFTGGLPGSSGYVVRVPRPTRIATEIFSEQEKAEVQAGGLRLRSRAGEYYLGLARRDAAPAARELVLLPQDAARVEEVTREQVATLVRTVTGDATPVRVIFEEPPEDER